MSRKLKNRWLLGLLAAGLLAGQTPLAAFADETDIQAEGKVLDEGGSSKQEEQTTESAPKSDDTENEITLEIEEAGPQERARESAANPQADDSDKSAGLVFDWLSQVPREETVYTAGGGEMIWIPELEGERVVSGILMLKNAVINSTGMGIKFPVPIEIKAEGENRITSESIGICLLNMESGGGFPELTVTGTGSLTIDSQKSAIQATGRVTIDTVHLDAGYASDGNGISATIGDVTIRNCPFIKIKNRTAGNSSGAVRASQSGNGTVRIENSHAIVINEGGPAISAVAGKVELISSDVRAIGNTNGGKGTLLFGECTMDGGTLFIQNKGGEDSLEISGVQPLNAINSAVIYGAQSSFILPLEGDCAWYIGCTYDEDPDEVHVPGSGYVFGDVVWNDNLYLGDGKTLAIGRYSKKDSSLTIPEGTTLDMPAGSKWTVKGYDSYLTKAALSIEGTVNMQERCEINNFSDCRIGEKGTLNIEGSQAGFYNCKIEGTVQNKGNLNISADAAFQNQNRLENSGTINGNFSTILITGYHAVVENTGEIHGFVIEMHDDSYINVANGKTVVPSGQMLTLGAGVASSGSRSRILKVLDGAELIVEDGATVDAKTHVTADTLTTYIDLSDAMVVNGELWLPDAVPDEIISQLAEKITGSGEVHTGDTTRYIVTVQSGEESQISLVESGSAADLPENPVRDGYDFRGWYVKEGEELRPFEPQTPITQSVEIISQWFGVNEWTKTLTIEGWSYGENAKNPSAAARFGEARYTYSESKDGEFTGEVPENVGTWYVKAIVDAAEDYSGLESEAVAFQIEPKAYEENGDITISAIENAEDVKNLVIRDGGKELINGTDYTVSVSESGTEGTATITFQGNYTGKITRTYQIAGEKPVQPGRPQKPEEIVTPKPSEIPEKPETPKPSEVPEQPGTPKPSEIPEKPQQPAVPGQTASINKKARISISGSRLKVSWSKVKGAQGYEIYAGKCGSGMNLVKTVKGSANTSAVVRRIEERKISQKGSYKVQIRAYRITDGKKEILAKTLTLHAVGNDNKNYTNAKSMKVSKTNLTIKAGGTKKIKAQIIKQNQKKKLLSRKHAALYRYDSTDKSVASVSKNGTIKGKRQGSCKVYAVAANGVKKEISVNIE